MTLPIYQQLMGYKKWANAGLYATIAGNMDALPDGDRAILMQILDHMYAVDDIFRHHLLGQAHGYGGARSPARPDFTDLAAKVHRLDDWYAGYAATLPPDRHDEAVAFRFTGGAPTRMRRGDMLLHIALHGTYHRGNAGIILQKNGVMPNDDRITDFVDTLPATA